MYKLNNLLESALIGPKQYLDQVAEIKAKLAYASKVQDIQQAVASASAGTKAPSGAQSRGGKKVCSMQCWCAPEDTDAGWLVVCCSTMHRERFW
jgi:hypothetical protein